MLYLEADPPNVTRAGQILTNILRDNQRAAQIIIHLRALLKKPDQTELQEFDLNEVVSDTVQIVGPEALKSGVELSTHHVNNSLPVRGDRIHLQQVILNLALNAIDAMQNCNAGRGKLLIRNRIGRRGRCPKCWSRPLELAFLMTNSIGFSMRFIPPRGKALDLAYPFTHDNRDLRRRDMG